MVATVWEELSFGRHLLAFSLDPTRLDRLERLTYSASNLKNPEPSKDIVARARSHPGYRALADCEYRPPMPDLDELMTLPGGSLGRAYAHFIRDHRLSLDFYNAPKSIHPGVPYLAERLARIHDIAHVLTGYAPDPLGELALQAFDMGQLPSAIPVSILVAGLLHLIRTRPTELGDAMNAIVDGYARGKRTTPLFAVPWEERFKEPLADLRREVGLTA